MRIVITTPSLRTPHGGTRVLNEWAVRMAQWHTVVMLVNSGPAACDWYQFPAGRVRLTKDKAELRRADCVIIGSPHAIHLAEERRAGAKCFIFLQMMEHLFNPNNRLFYDKCMKTYTSQYPLISISAWNMEMLKMLGRKGATHYVGNGVNTEHFPIEAGLHKGAVVLVEGWECTNQTKDTEAYGPRLAEEMKKQGCTVLAYSQLPLTRYPDVPDEYYQSPTLEQMNSLYRRARILIKASHSDARSTAPVEAMTKGTVTVRMITRGDDDLLHGHNCLRTGYHDYNTALMYCRQLLQDDEMYYRLSANCIEHVRSYSWDYWMNKINDILCKD